MNTATIIETILKERLPSEWDVRVGFADLRGLLEPRYQRYGHGMVILRKMDDLILDDVENGPTPPFSAMCKQYNRELDEVAGAVVKDLVEYNHIEAEFVWASAPEEELGPNYYETFRTEFSHKMVATRAGLGWIGKTDLLVSLEYGPRHRLVSVLTKEPLKEPGIPIEKSRCGECTVCVDACPASAATGDLWDIHTDRDLYYSAAKCRANCKKMTKELLGEDGTYCGICMSLCPRGRKK